MGTAYLVMTILLAAMLVFFGIGKFRRDPCIVRVVHERCADEVLSTTELCKFFHS